MLEQNTVYMSFASGAGKCKIQPFLGF